MRADAGHHPELLWAVRGAGGNFGIVTALEFDAYPVERVVHSMMVFDGSDTAPLLEQWSNLIESAPRELSSFLYAFAQRGGSPIVRLINVYADDDTQAAIDAPTPLLTIEPLIDQQAHVTPYAAILPPQGGRQRGGSRQTLISNGLADHLSPALAEQLSDGLRNGVAPWLSIRSVGGAVNDLDPAATAYAHRHQNLNVSSVGLGASEDDFHRYWDGLRPHLDELYLSFETDRRSERLHDAFPDDTLNRLRDLKAHYYPDKVFDQNFAIAPPSRTPTTWAISAHSQR